MPSAFAELQGETVAAHRPVPRIRLDAGAWRAAAAALAEGRWSLLGLWGEPGAVHMALFDPASAEIVVVSLDCPEARFPSVGAFHAPAIRLERAAASLYGLVPEGSPDERPWLDLGYWGVRHPLGAGTTAAATLAPYAFLPVEGESLHEIAVGPVHAGIIEPGHFRFTVNGETVVRLEERLGWVHKGIDGLMTDAPLDRAARLASHISGDSAVAYSIAFARAVEHALGVEAPPRAVWLRALMAELERLANHFGDFGAICNDASFSIMHAHCGVLRERVLRAADAVFGHRLMMDRIVPGGVAEAIDLKDAAPIRALLREIDARLPDLVTTYDSTTSLLDRTVGTGIVSPDLAARFAAGGHVGRASGRAFDSRKTPGYPPYDDLAFDVPILTDGDVNARVWIRIREIEESVKLIGAILDRLPGGATKIEIGSRRGIVEGIALAEAFRGDVLAWVRLDGDRVARCHLRDASWFQWPLLEAAIEGNIVADFPLCNKSFNCSYSGHDL